MRLFSDASLDVADPWLRRAFLLAERGRGTTSPNPMVGCVLVKDGVVVGEGSHLQAGGPHAEVMALSAAADAARGSEAYVTLEPCNHEGRTPPCASALIQAGVSRVIIGMADPNPGVAGGGAEALRAGGVEVRFAEDPKPFKAQNEAWVKWVTTGVPWLQVKVAMSLDGRPAVVRERRCGISGPEARELTMRMREVADCVAVGSSTARIDDPRLDVRSPDEVPAERQPMRGVISRTDVPPSTLRVFREGSGRRVLVVSDRAEAADLESVGEAGVELVRYAYVDGITGALRALGGLGMTRVMLEAGPGMLTATYDAGLIDELVLYQAGGMAGNAGPAAYQGVGGEVGGCLLKTMKAVEVGIAGADAVSVWRRPDA